MTLSTETLVRLTAQQKEYVSRRDRLAGELHQLKLEQKELDSSNVVMRKGKPSVNKKLHDNLKQQVSQTPSAAQAAGYSVMTWYLLLGREGVERKVIPWPYENSRFYRGDHFSQKMH